MYSRDELSNFTLQKLASIYPQNEEQERDLKEIFEKRASVSNYYTLTSLVDIRNGWQEVIIQKCVDKLRETMPPENPFSLTPEDEARLDSNVITKKDELELQAKLDMYNKKVSYETEPEVAEVEAVLTEVEKEVAEEVEEEIEEVEEEIPDVASTEKPTPKKKAGRPKKK